jgi:hypothetical protein
MAVAVVDQQKLETFHKQVTVVVLVVVLLLLVMVEEQVVVQEFLVKEIMEDLL